jgi:hypothetical protein
MPGKKRAGGSENCKQSRAQGDKYYPGLTAMMGSMFDVLMQRLGWDLHLFGNTASACMWNAPGLVRRFCGVYIHIRNLEINDARELKLL